MGEEEAEEDKNLCETLDTLKGTLLSFKIHIFQSWKVVSYEMNCCCGNRNSTPGKIWVVVLAPGMTVGTSANLAGLPLQSKGI